MTDFQQRRMMMVDTQVRPNDVTKYPVIAAMLDVPREDFVPESRRDIAYIGENLDLGHGRVLLEPRTLAMMVDTLDVQPTDLVLDVGCGYGYSAASLGRLAQAVVAKVPGVSMSVNTNAPPDRRSYRVDFSLFRSLAPAHQPAMTLENSITRIHDGLTSISFADSTFRSGPFIRLKEFERLMAAGLVTDDVRWNHASRALAS